MSRPLSLSTLSPDCSSISDPSYAILDFETTGLNPQRGDRAIEIGISLYRHGREVDTFASLINPGMQIPSFITRLTGISNDMVASAPPAHDVLQDAVAFIGNAQVVAHNASFDRKFWRREVALALGIECQRDFLCTLMLARRIFQSFGSHRLGDIARVLGIDTGRSHRALDDARVTSQVLATMLDRLEIAHPEHTIDAAFLRAYQTKARSQLPDLSHR